MLHSILPTTFHMFLLSHESRIYIVLTYLTEDNPVAVSRETLLRLTLHAKMTILPPRATVLPVALVDEFEFLFAAQGIELALLAFPNYRSCACCWV